MKFRLITLAAAAACCAITFSVSGAAEKPCPAIQELDSDSDGTLDLDEVKKLASKAFAKLNTDKDNTLEINEVTGRLSAEEFDKANPDKDKDKSLDEAEYLALAEARFAAANPDKDGTIDCAELDSEAGKALMKLLK